MHPFRLCPLLVAAAAAAPLNAERLDLDHRLHAGLHKALEQNNADAIYYDTSKPGAVFDRILIRGKSAERDWTEALELVTYTRNRKLPAPMAWFRAFDAKGETPCPAAKTVLARDDLSVTFGLRAAACPAGPALEGVYRVLYGKRTVYLAAGKVRGAMSDAERAEWLALLASANIAR